MSIFRTYHDQTFPNVALAVFDPVAAITVFYGELFIDDAPHVLSRVTFDDEIPQPSYENIPGIQISLSTYSLLRKIRNNNYY